MNEYKEQLDRMEANQNRFNDFVIKQTEINTKMQGHLDNHTKANKGLVWLSGVVLTVLGFFKLGG